MTSPLAKLTPLPQAQRWKQSFVAQMLTIYRHPPDPVSNLVIKAPQSTLARALPLSYSLARWVFGALPN